MEIEDYIEIFKTLNFHDHLPNDRQYSGINRFNLKADEYNLPQIYMFNLPNAFMWDLEPNHNLNTSIIIGGDDYTFYHHPDSPQYIEFRRKKQQNPQENFNKFLKDYIKKTPGNKFWIILKNDKIVKLLNSKSGKQIVWNNRNDTRYIKGDKSYPKYSKYLSSCFI